MSEEKTKQKSNQDQYKKTSVHLILCENKVVNGINYKKGQTICTGKCIEGLTVEGLNRGLQIKQFKAVERSSGHEF